MDLARFVRIKPASASRYYLIRDHRNGIGANCAIDLLSWGIGEGIAALSAAGQIVIDTRLAPVIAGASQFAKSGVNP